MKFSELNPEELVKAMYSNSSVILYKEHTYIKNGWLGWPTFLITINIADISEQVLMIPKSLDNSLKLVCTDKAELLAKANTEMSENWLEFEKNFIKQSYNFAPMEGYNLVKYMKKNEIKFFHPNT